MPVATPVCLSVFLSTADTLCFIAKIDEERKKGRKVKKKQNK
jgi:hypothetical protein